MSVRISRNQPRQSERSRQSSNARSLRRTERVDFSNVTDIPLAVGEVPRCGSRPLQIKDYVEMYINGVGATYIVAYITNINGTLFIGIQTPDEKWTYNLEVMDNKWVISDDDGNMAGYVTKFIRRDCAVNTLRDYNEYNYAVDHREF
jgi:hypothetical protein